MESDGKQSDEVLLNENLIQRIIQGNKQAEQELVSRYWRGMYFILYRRCNDPELSADLTQDTFIVVLKKARSGQISKPSAIASFIHQTGINLFIDNYRKETRQSTDNDSEIGNDMIDQSPDIYRSLQSEQMFKLVVQLIEEMKIERDRNILKYHYFYEYDKSKICNMLELTPEHFDRVLHRARNRLKQLIQHKIGGNTLTEDISNVIGSIFLLITLGMVLPSLCFYDYQPEFQLSVREISHSSHLLHQETSEGSQFNSGGGTQATPVNQLREA